MNKLLRSAKFAPFLRNQTFPKNIVTTDIPKENNSHLIKRNGFKRGEGAPFAYHDTYQYPDDYVPWSFNYKGNGLFIGAILTGWFAYFAYENSYLKRVGRTKRKQREYYQP